MLTDLGLTFGLLMLIGSLTLAVVTAELSSRRLRRELDRAEREVRRLRREASIAATYAALRAGQ